MDTRTQLEALLRHALDDDPRSALGAVRRLTADELPWLEERAVRLARQNGMSWARIARLLALPRQTAHRRFNHLDDGAPRRPEPIDWYQTGAEAEREFLRFERNRRLSAEFAAWESSGGDIVPW